MTIHFESALGACPRYPTGVSLHSHTHHSKESLGFIYRYTAETPLLRAAVANGERRYQKRHNGSALDFNRGWWTPPLSPHDAWQLERRHIEKRLDALALVSLSDHDDIEAGMSLSVLNECRHVPVSVEWTIPYHGTFFHVGIHNLPRGAARETMSRLSAITADPQENAIAEVLESLATVPDTLIVLNHPCWDESRVGEEIHRQALIHFVLRHGEWLHAAEINGLRPWTENRKAIDFAEQFAMAIISGGDRHALEPNVVLNLTSARTFGEFTGEIRDGESQVFVTRQYEQPFKMRVLQSIAEILDKHWMDRVFYACDDGVTRNLSELFKTGTPATVRAFTAGVHLLRHGVKMLRAPGLAPSKSQPC